MEYGSIVEKKPSSISYSLIRLGGFVDSETADHPALAILITINH
jgi:hypothetical protein